MQYPAVHVLYIDDSHDDQVLVGNVLDKEHGRFHLKVVDSHQAFQELLHAQAYDCVLTDLAMPGFSGMDAYDLVAASFPHLPVIIVTGTGSEELAVDAIKRGVDDYILKKHSHLRRLPSAIHAAIERRTLRRKSIEAAEALRRSEQRFRLAASGGTVWDWDIAAEITRFPPELAKILGYENEGLSYPEWLSLLHPEDRDTTIQKLTAHLERREPYTLEVRQRNKAGEYRWFKINGQAVWDEAGRATYIAGTIFDVTDRKQAEEALMYERHLLHSLMDNIPDHIFYKDRDLRYLRINRALADWMGVNDPAEAVGRFGYELMSTRLPNKFAQHEADIFQTGKAIKDAEVNYVVGGKTVWFSKTEVPVRNEKGEVTEVVAISRDITERKVAEERIHRLNRVYAVLSGINSLIVRVVDRRELFEGACRIAVEAGDFVSAHIAMIDPRSRDLRVVACTSNNRTYVRRLRAEWKDILTSADPKAELFRELMLEQQAPMVANDIDVNLPRSTQELARLSGSRAFCIIPLVVANETVGMLCLRARETGFFDAQEMKLLVELANDIGFALDHLDKGEKLKHLAHHDALTGLPTRSLLADRVKVALHQAARRGTRGALLFVDIDRFKMVNDSYGHEFGDKVLREVGGRLSAAIRASDTVSRHGGDEFLILLPEIDEAEDAARVAEKIIAEISQPLRIDMHDLTTTVSIGIAVFPDNGTDPVLLLSKSDTALYAAKDIGRNAYQFYSEAMNTRALERMTLEQDLRQAIVSGQLHAEFQPQLELTTGRVVGFEALARWNHPTRGPVSPARFIPVAEDSGLIIHIGEWMLREACRRNADWIQRGICAVPVAVNVSAIQFRQDNFVDIVEQVLKETGLDPRYLELEVTESVVMQGLDMVTDTLARLDALGLQLALDDFGTGYSSLSYLSRFPLRRLKIDQSFVRGLPDQPQAAGITRAILSMGESLGMRVVAEGVETQAEAEFLQGAGCEDVQGFLYCRPLPPSELEQWIISTRQSVRPIRSV